MIVIIFHQIECIRYHLSVTLSLPELPVSVLFALCTRGASTGDTFCEGMSGLLSIFKEIFRMGIMLSI